MAVLFKSQRCTGCCLWTGSSTLLCCNKKKTVSISCNNAVKHNLLGTADRNVKKKTILLVHSLRSYAGAESILFCHKFTHRERACSCYTLFLLISFIFPSSLSLPLSLSAAINLGMLLIGMVFCFFLFISQKHLTLIFAFPGIYRMPEKNKKLSSFSFSLFSERRVRALVCMHPRNSLLSLL